MENILLLSVRSDRDRAAIAVAVWAYFCWDFCYPIFLCLFQLLDQVSLIFVSAYYLYEDSA